MSLTVGCIGCGNMGSAILAGLARKGGYALCGCNRSQEKMYPLEKLGIQRMESPIDVAKAADVLVLAVKPYQIEAILQEVHEGLNKNTVLVSVAAGIGRERIARVIGNACPVVRCMPNTPALAGKGVFALCFEDPALSGTQIDTVRTLFSALGLCIDMAESRFTAFSALIGAGPAYVFAMMQGMVQAGVTLGFQHKEAREMITALFDGCAAMAGSSTMPLMQLRDAVCSPGGLTIAGVNVLDRAGLAGLLVEAVLAANTRGKEMEA